ncbi:MAG: helix-turn-helix transcriptional regulator [Flavobacteriaceae bacterium]|nr:helix-turn-helix transcriptional regulator [Flavobacteriaceae bacterium]
MIHKKPTYEKVNPDFGESILVKQHVKSKLNYTASWHVHPEIELVYVNKGKGKRHIGNHLSYFNNSQLILIGSNLPHNGFTDRLTPKGKETLIQFKPDIFNNSFNGLPEFREIINLFERAKKGIIYKPIIKSHVGPKIEKLIEYEGVTRVLKLLEILNDLATTKDYTLLNVNGFAFETEPEDSAKIDMIYKHINSNFQRQISLEEISDIASMTIPGFCRYFKNATGKTFTKLVNEYRVVHATKLLSESSNNITDICYECGFNNFSHFNKLFKEFTGKTALKYRKEMRRIIQ